MNQYFINLIFIIFTSFIYTLIEIEIEGKDGWMVNIPTCNIMRIGTKDMTLYHIYMLILIVTTIIFQNQMIFTINSFLYSASNVFLFIALEDTLWFIYNPYFTIKKYSREHIWWHGNQPWLLGMPLDNHKVISMNLLATYITQNYYILYSLISSALFVLLSIYIAPYYHSFYKKTHLFNCIY